MTDKPGTPIEAQARCRQCARPFKKNPRAPKHLFCSLRCKDRFHNEHNPRGKFAHLAGRNLHEYASRAAEEGWDGHKGQF